MILLCARVTVKKQQQRKLNNKNKKKMLIVLHILCLVGGFGVETSFMLMEIIKL